MSENKLKRLIVAGTITAILFVVILLSVMVYQLVSISVERKRNAELDATIERLEQLKEEVGEDIENRSERWWIEQRARELGYLYDTDHKLD